MTSYSKTGICPFCSAPYNNWGNNPAPLIGDPCCDECNECKCKPVCKQKFLMIKVRTHEECVHKCVANECDACSGPTLITPLAPAMPKGEKIPAPKPGAEEVETGSATELRIEQ